MKYVVVRYQKTFEFGDTRVPFIIYSRKSGVYETMLKYKNKLEAEGKKYGNVVYILTTEEKAEELYDKYTQWYHKKWHEYNTKRYLTQMNKTANELKYKNAIKTA